MQMPPEVFGRIMRYKVLTKIDELQSRLDKILGKADKED